MTVLVRSGVVAASRRYAIELVRPSSIAFAGGGSETASIVGLGSVDFSAVTSLSLNGVFSAEYDNYMVVCRSSSSQSNVLTIRLRASGSDATGTDYTWQYLESSSTSVGGLRGTSATNFLLGAGYNTQRTGRVAYFYGPNLAQPTAMRTVEASDLSSAYIFDVANTQSLSTAYDGFTILRDAGSITGNVAVYGLRG